MAPLCNIVIWFTADKCVFVSRAMRPKLAAVMEEFSIDRLPLFMARIPYSLASITDDIMR